MVYLQSETQKLIQFNAEFVYKQYARSRSLFGKDAVINIYRFWKIYKKKTIYTLVQTLFVTKLFL